jgi:hypothetical protein
MKEEKDQGAELAAAPTIPDVAESVPASLTHAEEIEALGQFAHAMNQMTPTGRLAAMHWLMDFYNIPLVVRGGSYLLRCINCRRVDMAVIATDVVCRSCGSTRTTMFQEIAAP